MKLAAPADLASAALAVLRTTAIAKHSQVGNSKADWRTIALDRRTDAEKIDSMAAQAVAFLESHGASAETVEDARSYVRKLQGGGKKTSDDPNTPDIDESEKAISKSQQSNAAIISTFFELIDYLEAQTEYADVKNPGFTIAELRAFAQSVQTKHIASINAAAALSSDRAARDKVFYIDEKCVLNIAKRYKKLVFGAYGGKSAEYALVNAIRFQKPKK